MLLRGRDAGRTVSSGQLPRSYVVRSNLTWACREMPAERNRSRRILRRFIRLTVNEVRAKL